MMVAASLFAEVGGAGRPTPQGPRTTPTGHGLTPAGREQGVGSEAAECITRGVAWE